MKTKNIVMLTSAIVLLVGLGILGGKYAGLFEQSFTQLTSNVPSATFPSPQSDTAYGTTLVPTWSNSRSDLSIIDHINTGTTEARSFRLITNAQTQRWQQEAIPSQIKNISVDTKYKVKKVTFNELSCQVDPNTGSPGSGSAQLVNSSGECFIATDNGNYLACDIYVELGCTDSAGRMNRDGFIYGPNTIQVEVEMLYSGAQCTPSQVSCGTDTEVLKAGNVSYICANGTWSKQGAVVGKCGIVTAVEENKTFYRLASNQCSTVQILQSAKTANDYATQAECQAKINVEQSNTNNSSNTSTTTSTSSNSVNVWELLNNECKFIQIDKSATLKVNQFSKSEDCSAKIITAAVQECADGILIDKSQFCPETKTWIAVISTVVTAISTIVTIGIFIYRRRRKNK